MVLTETEVQQRIELLKRFRLMLEQQRQKFRNYLSVLDSQEKAMEEGDIEKVSIHGEIEQSILSEILSLQKVIDPLQEMYHHNFPGGDREITELQESLGRLQHQVLERNQATRDYLIQQKDLLQQKISSLRFPRSHNKIYGRAPQPTMLDIRA